MIIHTKKMPFNLDGKCFKIISFVDKTLFIIGLLFFLYSYNIGYTTWMFYAILIVFFSSLLYCCQNIKKRLGLLLFYLVFFLFLMGRMFVDLFTYGYVTYNFDPPIGSHINLCLFISIVFLRFGFLIIEKFIKLQDRPLFQDKYHLYRIKKISKFIFYLAILATIPMVLEEFFYILNDSYGALYTSFESKIPSIIRVISNMRTISVFVFLGCFPDKKEIRIPIIFILLNGCLQMLTGDRTNLSQAILIIVFYYGLRQLLAPEEKWIKKSYIIIAFIVIPFFLAFMSFFVYIREGFNTNEVTIFNQFIRFFRSIGRSVDVIGYGKYYESELPSRIYTIADIINYFKYNQITAFLFDMHLPAQHTKDFALGGYSFMHSLTYLIDPELYLKGHGAGSSYVAEAYFDLGYIGVAVLNTVYGAFLAYIYKSLYRNPIIIGCFLQAINIMFYVPRGAADYPITYILNITVISALLIILVYSYNDIILNKLHKLKRKMKNG